MRNREANFRVLAGIGALLVFAVLWAKGVIAAPPDSSIQVKIDSSQVGPREVEDQTQQSIARDYAKAWQNLEQALEKNNPGPLGASFVGFARDRWASTVAEQAKAGISRKFVDRGHQARAVFYSIEGSAMVLKDTAQFEVQYLDGGKVVHSEQLTAHYVVLMTPAENSWKVRVLDEEPAAAPKQAAEIRVSGEGAGSK